MAWNLHIVGDKVLEEVDAIGAAIVKAVEDAGHQVLSAILTTDLGSSDITPAAPAEPAPAEAPPAEAPADPTPADPAVPVDTPPAA